MALPEREAQMSRELQTLHNVAYFVGALAHGAEQNLGRGSLSICSMAGKKFGQEAVEGGRQTDDPEEAVAILHEALKKAGNRLGFRALCG